MDWNLGGRGGGGGGGKAGQHCSVKRATSLGGVLCTFRFEEKKRVGNTKDPLVNSVPDPQKKRDESKLWIDSKSLKYSGKKQKKNTSLEKK